MRNKKKLVCGIGVNDANYQVYAFERIEGKQKRVWICPFYQCWKDMLTRAYDQRFHSRRPTYKECSVVKEWHSFSIFKAWMNAHDWHGKSLDKDILFPGNKIYGPDRCVFVSKELNNFLGDCGRARGEYPIGVSMHKRTGTLRSDCMNPFTGRQESLGHFDSADAAHAAWRARKHQHACRYADMQADPRIAQALRTRYLPASEEI